VDDTSAAPKPPVREERIPLGIAYMLAATVLFAGSSAASKWLVASYPVGEVLFSRSATSLVGATMRCAASRRRAPRRSC
jgi:drug/metabolite transporter (DMT)-like permease